MAVPRSPAYNWTPEDIDLVGKAAKQFYVPKWLAVAIYIGEDGVRGYEGGQATQSAFSSDYVQNTKAKQILTMCQTIRRCVNKYMEVPYVRQAWASTTKNQDDFLWKYRTDFIRFTAKEWAPRNAGETAEETESRWAKMIVSITNREARK